MSFFLTLLLCRFKYKKNENFLGCISSERPAIVYLVVSRPDKDSSSFGFVRKVFVIRPKEVNNRSMNREGSWTFGTDNQQFIRRILLYSRA